jgi:hypothetical protein
MSNTDLFGASIGGDLEKACGSPHVRKDMSHRQRWVAAEKE